jgi:hypothetical protein
MLRKDSGHKFRRDNNKYVLRISLHCMQRKSEQIPRNWFPKARQGKDRHKLPIAIAGNRKQSPPMMKTALQVSGRPSLSLMVGSSMPYLTEISRVGSAMMGKSIVILFSQ